LAYFAAAFGVGRTDREIEESPDSRFVSPSVRAELLAPRDRFWADPPAAEQRRRFMELRNRIVRELHLAEGKLLAGSGAPSMMMLPGFSIHRELQAMVDAGLPPFAAIATATTNPANFLSGGAGGGRTEYATVDEGAIRFESSVSREVDFGSIGLGMRASLVLLGSNPLDDVANTRDIEGVVLRGRWLPREELDALLARAAGRLSTASLTAGS
jgi:hypothetical protein